MKNRLLLQTVFQLYSPCGEFYCYAVIFGFQPSDIALRQLKANIISLRQRRNITFAKGENITPNEVRYITKKANLNNAQQRLATAKKQMNI